MPIQKLDNPFLPAALRWLRHNAGKTLDDIAPALGVTKQGLAKWETGERRLTEKKVADILRAIGATEDELEDALARVAAKQGVELQAREPEWWRGFAANLKSIRVDNEDMSPWAEPDEIILYEIGRYPGRLEGCVLELPDGARLLRLYEKTDGSSYFVKRLNPEQTETYPRDGVKIHRVALRGRQ